MLDYYEVIGLTVYNSILPTIYHYNVYVCVCMCDLLYKEDWIILKLTFNGYMLLLSVGVELI